MPLMGREAEVKAGEEGKRRKDPAPVAGRETEGMDLICISFLSLPNK